MAFKLTTSVIDTFRCLDFDCDVFGLYIGALTL